MIREKKEASQLAKLNKEQELRTSGKLYNKFREEFRDIYELQMEKEGDKRRK